MIDMQLPLYQTAHPTQRTAHSPQRTELIQPSQRNEFLQFAFVISWCLVNGTWVNITISDGKRLQISVTEIL